MSRLDPQGEQTGLVTLSLPKIDISTTTYLQHGPDIVLCVNHYNLLVREIHSGKRSLAEYQGHLEELLDELVQHCHAELPTAAQHSQNHPGIEYELGQLIAGCTTARQAIKRAANHS